jgi:hypothetical protein
MMERGRRLRAARLFLLNSRSFGSYGSLRRHMDEHTPPRRCRNRGKQFRDDEYHRC